MSARRTKGSGRAPRVEYRLVRRPAPPVVAPALDEAQRAVVEHSGGPLLVLAGPGTGKTTTLVEAVARRVEAGTDLERIAVLTFSRKAAGELRERIARRIGRTTATPAAVTFHSFCHTLVAAHRPAEDAGVPLRLLSATEQDVAVRELLRGTVVDGRPWPATIARCLDTRGLAEEVRDVLARVGERGIDLRRVAEFADAEDAAVWRALAAFADEYADVLDARGVLDYTELVRRAVALAESPPVRAQLRERFDAVFVDEYQDSDPAQVRLLQAMAGDGRDLVVFGDPDQSIYAFRGADVRGILDFPQAFGDRTGAPARTLVLRTSRRAVPELLAASREVARRLPLAGLPADAARAHRDLRPSLDPGPGPALEVLTFPSVGAELEHVADVLRRAHLADGVPWSDMAVLVRSGTRTIPVVRRVLGAAGVPLEVAGDEIALRAEPAVALLLTALKVASTLAADPPSEAGAVPAALRAVLTPEAARTLLLSPLGGIDPADLRRLGRALRAEARAGGLTGEELAPSAELIRDALAVPRLLIGPDAAAAGAARRLGELLAKVAADLAAGGSAEEALWRLWEGTSWPEDLARSAAGSGAAARRADRDLDAVCALFDLAARAEEKAGRRGVANFLAEIEAQEIPSEAPRSADGTTDAVRVLTAHRSKGLEWPLVAVVGVQEGLWPDLRRRGSLLQADRLEPDGLAPVPSIASVVAEERRLFYVAVTRAKQRLIVTAVDAPDEDGDRPSRFLRELGVEVREVRTRPARTLAPAALVASLRAVLEDPASSDALRAVAAGRLATLADARDGAGRPLVPSAAPERWWGTVDPSDAEVPVRPLDEPLKLSASAVQGLTSCPLRWFLQREVSADSAPTIRMTFGNVLHALAEEVARTGVDDLDALMKRLDTVWSELTFDAPWQSSVQREAAREALRAFLAWHSGRPDRELVGAEVPFDIHIDAGGETVHLRGSLDRIERDADGRTRVVDFKTSKSSPTKEEIAAHPQLATYQAAVAAGALDDLGVSRECGGAELVMLRQVNAKGLPKVNAQDACADAENPNWALELLGEAAQRLREEQFTPRPSDDCDMCEYRRCCSGRAEGRQVIT
ncbi:ATP-dependent DNA helicase [Sporichthya brevicatena]|uniref:DNA 3'-5' helicase n=1 Tax=Sporichthya brevicatena TaxID=171442 RepID=A0ABP3S8C8_9ACTN